MSRRVLLAGLFIVLGVAVSVMLAEAQGPRPKSPRTSPGTGFTYQGQLKNNAALVNGKCDLAFRLYDALSGGNQIGSPITQTIPITNGLFTAELNAGNEFGASAFNGEARWLEIRVSNTCPAGGTFTTLSPREALSAVPYAQYALSASSVITPTLRRYYLTINAYNGAQALTAGAPGYHMSTLWEIFNVSTLRYDTSLGYTTTDSGQGPAWGQFGWFRTGSPSNGANSLGANCNAWTSNSSALTGTAVSLQMAFGGSVTYLDAPWALSTFSCNSLLPVWYVQDLP